MSHGPLPREPRPPQAIVNPGPVLHIRKNGAEFCDVPLTQQQALTLARDLIVAVQVRLEVSNG